MKKTILHPYLSVLLVLAGFLLGTPESRAQTRVGVVDMKRVFDGYWKTKQADSNLKVEAGGLDEKRKAMLEDYQKATEEYKTLLESANDQAVSENERERRKKSAEAKLLQIRELEQQVAQFDRSARSQLGSKQRQIREKIMAEIQEVIASKARAAGYSLVLDTAGQTVNETPVILFTDNQNDITDAVLVQLNQGAPVEFRAPAGDKK